MTLALGPLYLSIGFTDRGARESAPRPIEAHLEHALQRQRQLQAVDTDRARWEGWMLTHSGRLF